MDNATHSPTRRVRRPLALALATGILACTAGTIVMTAKSWADPTDPDDGQFHTLTDGQLPTARPTLRESRAPLSSDEIGYAVHLATSADGVPPDTSDVAGREGPQLLFTDLPPIGEATSTARLAAVTLYDYTSDLAYQVDVNLTSGTAEPARSDPLLQPPPTADEAAAAMQLAIDPSLDLDFQRQFEQANGLPLLSIDQVQYRAGVWTFDTTTRSGQLCGKHRCLQLLVRDPSGVYLGTKEFVVDLSSRSVVLLNEDSQ